MTTDTARHSRRPLLVFGDDGSSPADTAWEWINDQPWPGWHMDVLTADTRGHEVEWGAPPRVIEWQPDWGRTEEPEGVEELRFLKVVTDPRAMLADAEGVDLMVVGLRTHSFIQGFVTGSTTEWLLHHPPAPMIVAGRAGTVRKVVLCTDGSEHARAARQSFCSMPLSARSAVTVLGVQDGRTDAEAAVSDAARALEGRVAAVDTRVVKGEPTSHILEHLEAEQPDLVVLGTRGLTGWKRLRLGSTASAVVRGAPCSSLISAREVQ
ncbi:MAG: universal stress protein [Actinomycetota bacterium]